MLRKLDFKLELAGRGTLFKETLDRLQLEHFGLWITKVELELED